MNERKELSKDTELIEYHLSISKEELYFRAKSKCNHKMWETKIKEKNFASMKIDLKWEKYVSLIEKIYIVRFFFFCLNFILDKGRSRIFIYR